MASSRGAASSQHSGTSGFIQSFYPNTSGEEAERILKSVGKNGSFLLRLCSQVNGYHHYILSVMSNQCIVHLKIQCDNDRYNMCGEVFESPYDVIQCCVENPHILKQQDGSVIELKQPVINARKPSRWFHGNIYPKDAERILNEKGKYGSYLVRSSYRHPGDYALCVRLKDEIISVKIYANGEKFDVGGGGQFNNINDLISHYKKYPLKTDNGVDIHLDQGIDSDSLTMAATEKPATKLPLEKPALSIPPINWPTEYCIVTLSTVCSGHGCQGKADGKIQICEGQNGTMTINLNGSTKTSNSLACCQFKMYKAPMDPDDIAHSYDVICLENCAHPRHYISWCKQGANYEVKIYSSSSGDKQPPPISGICWFRCSKKASCDERDLQGVEKKIKREVTNTCSTCKLVAWTDKPYQPNIDYQYLTFNATNTAPDNYSVRLTTEFSLSSDVEFCGDTENNLAKSYV